MDSKENSDQGMQGSACSQLIHYGRPTLHLIHSQCSLVLSGGSLEITVTFHRQNTTLPHITSLPAV